MKTKSMKILKMLVISSIFIACKSKQDKIKETFSSDEGKKWYSYNIRDERDIIPYRVKEFYSDGRMKDYTHYVKTGELQRIPYDDEYNTERWFIINDTIVSIYNAKNPTTGFYHKYRSKILYCSKDTIILQNDTKDLTMLVRYNGKQHEK
jgi:lipoprotein